MGCTGMGCTGMGCTGIDSGGVPGCKSTRTELLPGRIVRCVSPATTSTSSGGKTVRALMVTGGGSGRSCAEGAIALASTVTRCFRLGCGLAANGDFATGAGGCTGTALATGELSIGSSNSASCSSGNQKSRLRQRTMPSATKSRQRDANINLRCFGSSGAILKESARKARSVFGMIDRRSNIQEPEVVLGALLSVCLARVRKASKRCVERASAPVMILILGLWSRNVTSRGSRESYDWLVG